MTKYARATSVSADRSRLEIEKILKRYGAGEFGYLNAGRKVLVAFSMNQRQIRFAMEFDPVDKFYVSGAGRRRKENIAQAHQEQSTRAKWRALALCIKAKLEAVESGISHFEDEFLANFVMPNGRTFGECVAPQIEQVYKNGSVPARLLIAAPEKNYTVQIEELKHEN
jgi:hypothetical protein